MNHSGEIIRWAWVLWLIVWIAASRWSAPTVKVQSARSRTIQHVLMVLGGCLLFFSFDTGTWAWVLAHRLFHRSEALSACGLLLVLTGLGYTFWARIHLGRNWSSSVTLKAEHALVRTGPYRFSRHPIYTGILAALIGTGMAKPTIGALMGLGLIVLALLLKTQDEEKLLLSHFGEAYRDYRFQVRALIPYVR